VKEKKAYTATDLGGGDGGKGSVVHKLCALRRPHTVIKVGGTQGSHGVKTARGQKFNFSQFGCGTFDGARTFLSDRFVFSPVGLLREAHALRYEQGIHDPMALVAIDGRALVTTSFHGIASRLKELARGENPRGIVGVGVGEAYYDSLLYPDLAIRARDLARPDLRDRLAAARRQKLHDLALVFEMKFMDEDAELVKEEVALIRNDEFFNWVVEEFEQCAKVVKIVDDDYLGREILSRDGVIVVESSHGVLTDRFHGFHPHTTRLRTVPEVTSWSLLRENGWDGEVVRLGVTRSYQIRHGAGPLVVDDSKMAEALLPHEVGNPNRYRGKVRVGPLDFVALRYAKEVCGGNGAFDALAMTWFDSPMRLGAWEVCDRYNGSLEPRFFTKEGNIIVRRGEDNDQLWYQEALGRELQSLRPVITRYELPKDSTQESAIELVREIVSEKLGVPLRMLAFGPTELDEAIF